VTIVSYSKNKKDVRITGRNWDDIKKYIIGAERDRSTPLDEGKLIAGASNMFSTIKSKAPRGPNGLYNRMFTKDSNLEHTYSSALVGVLAAVNGDMEEAKRIYGLIKEKVKKGSNGLYGDRVLAKVEPSAQTTLVLGGKASNKSNEIINEFTDANAAFGILAAAVGDIEEARNQYHLIQTKIPKGNFGMYVHGALSRSDQNECSNANAAAGILAALLGYLEDAKAIYWLIDDSVPKGDSGMYCNGVYKKEEGTDANALMGVLAHLIGYKDKSRKLYVLIEKNVPKSDSGMYSNAIKSAKESIPASAAVAILAATIGGLAICKQAGDR